MQAQPVPMGDWDNMCLYQWDKHNLSQMGLGKVKRDLSLSHGTSHVPTLEAFPCPGTSSIPTMELVPVQTCPTKWVYKSVKNSQKIAKNQFKSYNSTANFSIFKIRIFRISRPGRQISDVLMESGLLLLANPKRGMCSHVTVPTSIFQEQTKLVGLK